ncbi:MAG TPA: hypothetical protein VFJ98_10500 [Mycobacteriales bacterium]|nr:hypothetical protein [Mycobacteriales bacterium]
MSNITEAATRCGMPAVGFVPMAHGLVPSSFAAAKGSASAAYQALIVETRNDAQGGARAWRPPV